MTLSTLLKLTSSALRGQPCKILSRELLKTSSVLSVKQQHCHVLCSPTTIQQDSLLKIVQALPKREFTISQPFLAQVDAHKQHDHVTVWRLERLLSVALLPLIPLALASPCKELDTILSILIVMHNHWGLEAIVVDYIRPSIFGEAGPKVGMALLYIFSILTLAGLLNLIYNDIGLANTFKQLWHPPAAQQNK